MSTKTPTNPKAATRSRLSGGMPIAPAKVAPKRLAVTSRPVPKRVDRTRDARPAIHAVEGRAGVSLLTQTVDALRHAVLSASGPGVFLGSEDQLIASLGVSRPTFRQAAKLLRHENLLTIKRGIGGGFFTISPSGEAVSRMAAIYLNAQGTSLLQLNDVVAPLQAEAGRMVARAESSVRVRLREFLVRCETEGTPEQQLAPIPRMLAFEALLGELTGNPAIALVMQVMRDLVRDARHSYFKLDADKLAAYEHFQHRLAQAVAEGDAEMAALICDRHAAIVRSWLPDKPAALPV